MTVTLHCEDVVRWAEGYTGEPFHAMICDPPYGLEFMGQEWDTPDRWRVGAGFSQPGIGDRPTPWPSYASETANPTCVTCGGRLRGKRRCTCADPEWRVKGTAFANNRHRSNATLQAMYTTWFRALAQHLHPGAFGACFASSRGWHRLACAIEDAGLILHPSVFMLGWLQASGWPKSTKIDDERFDGHRYGLQALKPTVEPLLIWQKKYSRAPVDDITRTGAGALWIEGCRVAGPAPHHNYGRTSGPESMAGASAVPFNTPPSGRWPSNVSLIHTPACQHVGDRQVKGITGGQWPIRHRGYQWNGRYVSPDFRNTNSHIYVAADGTETVQHWVCAPDCPVAALEAQAGEHPSGARDAGTRSSPGWTDVSKGQPYPQAYEASSGPVSRFYPQFGWADDIAERLALADPLHYCAKASQAERSAGLPARNLHPTLKPLALLRWIAALFLPPAAYAPRRLLVPFSGSGSECISAIQTCWEEVVGIEQDPAYVEIARHRIAYWTGQQTTAPAVPRAPVTPTAPAAVGEQLGLFTTPSA
jgi:hypothetical protein